MQEKYEQLKQHTDVQDGSEADDHIFFKACGGWSDKGTVYGLGREAPAIYDRPSRRGTSGTSSTYSPSFVARLQERLSTTEEELRATREELGSTREELGATRQELEATKKLIEDQRLALIELHARFESFSSILGHPTRAGSSDHSC